MIAKPLSIHCPKLHSLLFFLLFNAALNYDKLGVGRAEPTGGQRQRSTDQDQ